MQTTSTARTDGPTNSMYTAGPNRGTNVTRLCSIGPVDALCQVQKEKSRAARLQRATQILITQGVVRKANSPWADLSNCKQCCKTPRSAGRFTKGCGCTL